MPHHVAAKPAAGRFGGRSRFGTLTLCDTSTLRLPGERRSVVSSSKGSTFPRPPRDSRIRPSRFRASAADRARRRDPEAGEREGDRFGRGHHPSPEIWPRGRPAGSRVRTNLDSHDVALRAVAVQVSSPSRRAIAAATRRSRRSTRGARSNPPERSYRPDRDLRSACNGQDSHCPAMSTRFRIDVHGP